MQTQTDNKTNCSNNIDKAFKNSPISKNQFKYYLRQTNVSYINNLPPTKKLKVVFNKVKKEIFFFTILLVLIIARTDFFYDLISNSTSQENEQINNYQQIINQDYFQNDYSSIKYIAQGQNNSSNSNNNDAKFADITQYFIEIEQNLEIEEKITQEQRQKQQKESQIETLIYLLISFLLMIFFFKRIAQKLIKIWKKNNNPLSRFSNHNRQSEKYPRIFLNSFPSQQQQLGIEQCSNDENQKFQWEKERKRHLLSPEAPNKYEKGFYQKRPSLYNENQNCFYSEQKPKQSQQELNNLLPINCNKFNRDSLQTQDGVTVHITRVKEFFNRFKSNQNEQNYNSDNLASPFQEYQTTSLQNPQQEDYLDKINNFNNRSPLTPLNGKKKQKEQIHDFRLTPRKSARLQNKDKIHYDQQIKCFSTLSYSDLKTM